MKNEPGLEPTPSAPLSGAVESDAEVVEIEDRHERWGQGFQHLEWHWDQTETRVGFACAHKDRATLLRKLRTSDGELAKIRGVQFSPTGDNHHNALLCPYCNPNKLELRQAPAAQMVGFVDPDRLLREIERAHAEYRGWPLSDALRAYRDHLLSSGVVKQMPTREEIYAAIAGRNGTGTTIDGCSVLTDAILALFRAPDEVKREGGE